MKQSRDNFSRKVVMLEYVSALFLNTALGLSVDYSESFFGFNLVRTLWLLGRCHFVLCRCDR